ncbi:2-aminoethylphosphonate--pyruvate transaminase [Fulvivirgaceae bacterium BMA10]|uniref:2-aminoethylphosphonate--pyruvate transaminase n=1 Tax=Splendidivirga corallicola TaxID=3051826 RepID=A0ABT8KLE5_9BACT|nr:2-aminoethylphosphonate--pyruvate transaminase [Fulvivirgaceae bacterium BMA10]
MNTAELPENPYFLLTPGPLSTSKSVKAAMLRDWCTWDDDYNIDVVQEIRKGLISLATKSQEYTSILMQGSGTFSVEATIGSVLPPDGKLLVLSNGAYGQRLAQIAQRLKIDTVVHDSGEIEPPDLELLERTLQSDKKITHVVVVHCETTTGMLNPIEDIGRISKKYNKIYIVDAMSSFGGIPMDIGELDIDFMISSANKCIQGVPGFGFILARKEVLVKTSGFARSLSLDLYDQWKTLEEGNGKWRYTSPTHTVRAFLQAMKELHEEGGVGKRYERYRENHQILVDGMNELGINCLLPKSYQSPIITSFNSPNSPSYDFKKFYTKLKAKGFVIYPGKVSTADTFRIGNIGHVFPDDFRSLIKCVADSIFW